MLIYINELQVQTVHELQEALTLQPAFCRPLYRPCPRESLKSLTVPSVHPTPSKQLLGGAHLSFEIILNMVLDF